MSRKNDRTGDIVFLLDWHLLRVEKKNQATPKNRILVPLKGSPHPSFPYGIHPRPWQPLSYSSWLTAKYWVINQPNDHSVLSDTYVRNSWIRLLLQGDHLNAFFPSLTTLAIMYSPLLHRSPFPSCPRPNLQEETSALNALRVVR